MKVKSLSRVRHSATPWTAAHQAPPSMGFSRQEYCCFNNVLQTESLKTRQMDDPRVWRSGPKMGWIHLRERTKVMAGPSFPRAPGETGFPAHLDLAKACGSSSCRTVVSQCHWLVQGVHTLCDLLMQSLLHLRIYKPLLFLNPHMLSWGLPT